MISSYREGYMWSRAWIKRVSSNDHGWVLWFNTITSNTNLIEIRLLLDYLYGVEKHIFKNQKSLGNNKNLDIIVISTDHRSKK